jgi:chemotaxis protein MotB
VIESNTPIYLEEEADEGSWAISYADMITILLAFFTIFFSFDHSAQDEDLLERSMLTSLISTLEPATIESNASQTDPLLQWREVMIDGQELVVEKIDRYRYAIIFKGLSFFDTGSVVLKQQVKANIDDIASKLMPYMGSMRLKLHSFTDPRPVLQVQGRKFDDNLELSTLRSLSVYRELKARGIPENRLEIVGGGVLPQDFYQRHFAANEELDFSLMRTTVIILDREASL